LSSQKRINGGAKGKGESFYCRKCDREKKEDPRCAKKRKSPNDGGGKKEGRGKKKKRFTFILKGGMGNRHNFIGCAAEGGGGDKKKKEKERTPSFPSRIEFLRSFGGKKDEEGKLEERKGREISFVPTIVRGGERLSFREE